MPEVESRPPTARWILVAGDGIDRVDASGEEATRRLADRLRTGKAKLAISGLAKQALEEMRAAGL